MARTHRTILPWVSRALKRGAISPHNAFALGSDKVGRKIPIFDVNTRDEVWGEGNKRATRKCTTRKERARTRQEIQKTLQELNSSLSFRELNELMGEDAAIFGD